MSKSIKKSMSFKIDFGAILVDFGKENGGKLAPKSNQKSKPPLKRKNQLNTSRLVFSWLSGLQVGSENRSKIDQKLKSTWEGLLDSIFLDFDGFGDPTWAQVGRENRAKTGQDRTRQGKTGQDKTRQDKTRQDKTRQDKRRQRQEKTRL